LLRLKNLYYQDLETVPMHNFMTKEAMAIIGQALRQETIHLSKALVQVQMAREVLATIVQQVFLYVV
jgi:hypothetical protein